MRIKTRKGQNVAELFYNSINISEPLFFAKHFNHMCFMGANLMTWVQSDIYVNCMNSSEPTGAGETIKPFETSKYSDNSEPSKTSEIVSLVKLSSPVKLANLVKLMNPVNLVQIQLKNTNKQKRFCDYSSQNQLIFIISAAT